MLTKTYTVIMETKKPKKSMLRKRKPLKRGGSARNVAKGKSKVTKKSRFGPTPEKSKKVAPKLGKMKKKGRRGALKKMGMSMRNVMQGESFKIKKAVKRHSAQKKKI